MEGTINPKAIAIDNEKLPTATKEAKELKIFPILSTNYLFIGSLADGVNIDVFNIEGKLVLPSTDCPV